MTETVVTVITVVEIHVTAAMLTVTLLILAPVVA